MNVDQVIQAIVTGDFTIQELQRIQESVVFNRNKIRRAVKLGMKPGDRVKYNSPKLNITQRGEVEKVNRKFIIVKLDSGVRMQVPAEIIEKE